MKPAEFAKLFDISIETLRNYENMGILHPLRINGNRSYSYGDLLTMISLLKLKRFGLMRDQVRFHLSATSPERQIAQMILYEEELRKSVILEQVKLQFLHERIETDGRAWMNKDHYWIEVIKATYVIPFAEGANALDTDLRLNNIILSSALNHIEVTYNEMLFSFKDNKLISRWQLSMLKNFADQLHDETFCTGELRKAHHVLCTCTEVPDYSAMKDIVTGLILTAKEEYHLDISCPEVIVQPMFVTSQDSHTFIGKFSLIID